MPGHSVTTGPEAEGGPPGQALHALAGWLDAAGVPYALIGGVAVGLQAEPRFTQDVGAVVWTEDTRWADLLEAAMAFGIRPRIDDALSFAARTRVLLLSHEGVVPIDVSCGALPFEQELIEQAALPDVGSGSIRLSSSPNCWTTSIDCFATLSADNRGGHGRRRRAGRGRARRWRASPAPCRSRSS